MKCPFKDRGGRDCIHNNDGNCTGFCARISDIRKCSFPRVKCKHRDKEGNCKGWFSACKYKE